MRPSARALERKAEDRIAEERMREAVLERAEYRCEICGDAAQVVHHIEGRKAPQRDWPQELREDYPHVELNGIALCLGGHQWVHEATRHSRPLVWGWLLLRYGDLVWRGKTYREWFAGEGPWRGLLEVKSGDDGG